MVTAHEIEPQTQKITAQKIIGLLRGFRGQDGPLQEYFCVIEIPGVELPFRFHDISAARAVPVCQAAIKAEGFQ